LKPGNRIGIWKGSRNSKVELKSGMRVVLLMLWLKLKPHAQERPGEAGGRGEITASEPARMSHFGRSSLQELVFSFFLARKPTAI
jgi:hypothetical protein